MPRVNRDLQRRMAARRERERRRPPTERTYRFGSDAPASAASPEAEAAPLDAQAAAPTRAEAEVGPVPRASRLSPLPARLADRRPAPARPAPRPFAEYRDEYRYVGADLRRIAVVVGSLLVVLIVLYLALAR